MTLSFPLALLGLLAIPYFIWLGRPRGTFSRGRERASLILRILIVVLLVLGLAGLQVVKAADQLAVVFLIDVSDSMDEAAREAAERYVADVMSRMGPDDQAAVIVFGADALVERPEGNRFQIAVLSRFGMKVPVTTLPGSNHLDELNRHGGADHWWLRLALGHLGCRAAAEAFDYACCRGCNQLPQLPGN